MPRYMLVVLVMAGLLTSCGFRRKKYDNPITKDTKQPDKVLYDKAIADIEHSRFEIARITLNTLINTYDQSEFLAKAKLAVADSWYREGGTAGLAQAGTENKDFILFYPTIEKAPQSEEKKCFIPSKQMEKSDRDPSQALRADQECRQLIVQFPNSKFVPEAQQLLRNIQEALGDAEYNVGSFYFKRGDTPAAANRLTHLVDQYPLYSKADAALWELGDSYGRLGPRFRKQAGEAYARLVKDYPLSGYADAAKKKLTEMELAVPEADPVAVDRMKWEAENRQKQGILPKYTSFLRRGPDVSSAARSGTPAMTTMRPDVPVSVPQVAAGGTGVNDVTNSVITNSSALDNNKDARAHPPAPTPGSAAAPDSKPADAQSAQPAADAKAQKKKNKDKKQKQPATPPAGTATPTS